MTDHSKNSRNATISSSTPSQGHNTASVPPYTILASNNPTKIKLRRNHSFSTASTSTSNVSTNAVSQSFVDGNTNPAGRTSRVTRAKRAVAPTVVNYLIPAPSSTNTGNSSAAGTGYNYSWHTPYVPTPPTTNSSTHLSTAASAFKSTIAQKPQWSNSYQSYQSINSAAGTGASTGFHSGYNGISVLPLSNANSSSNYSASVNSIPLNAAPVNNLFPAMPIIYPPINNLHGPNVTTRRGRKRQTTVKEKSPAKKPRGRPKKDHRKLKSTAPSSLALNAVLALGNTLPISKYPMRHVISATSTSSATSTAMTLPSASIGIPQTSNAPTSFFEPLTIPGVVEITPPRLTANVPMPPHWFEHSEDTIMSLFTFKKYSVSSTSPEYQTISNMLHPVQVKGIEQIVNPDLWQRFVNTRKEMVRSKTDDLRVLEKLGLDEREVMRCAHLTLNFAKDPLLTPYSCNMSLLFHCTRNQSNLNNILSQGLDERLSNISGGLLGKGIYFSDDPQKSMQYDGTGCILIFAVLLGDCISVDHFNNKSGLVREPEKVKQQKRNFNDQFFDSIVARPAGYNEYVIYNRYQCCPLYQVEYIRSAPPPMQYLSNFNYATQNLPPIAWIPEGPNYAMPIQKMVSQWPFYAVDLFEKMGVTPPKDDDYDDDSDIQNEIAATAASDTPNMSIDEKLTMLINLGYYDEHENREILLRFNNDLDQAVNYLLDNANALDDVMDCNQPSTSAAVTSSSFNSLFPSTSTSNASIINLSKSSVTKNSSIETIDLIDDDSVCSDVELITDPPSKTEFNAVDLKMELPYELAEWALEFDADYIKKEIAMKPTKSPATLELEECLICCNEYESFEVSPSLWKELECSHKLCLACYSNILTTRTTISGAQHTFVKCPFCQGITGIEIGTCPDIQMNVSIVPHSCESFEPTSSIQINYVIDSGYKLNRTAYLPNNAEGQKVLSLLRIAWDRRLCFTIGTSVTTGQENVIVWNIHHKTSLRGGVSSYGYPDPSYLERVKFELKAFGIE